MQVAGLLTYLPVFPAFPCSKKAQWQTGWKSVMELTAAGQFRIYTGFPFNPKHQLRNQKQGKGKNIWLFPIQRSAF
ncbi:hypothetical protein AB669_00135 [Pedobacter sp. BMA]|nr:hypothetical protein AB669_00135 [Pedobacter sp. BMA]